MKTDMQQKQNAGADHDEAFGHSPAVEIGRKIEAALQLYTRLESQYIQVSMRDGTVTLRGEVDSSAEKAAAFDAAWSSPGVQTVIDELLVR
ncbi:BON domain-containing protein [Pandoraea sp.]|uniref:BON domain-containing protein n=1 Tax=Pandoraea sp. TaxID=1883445 RepID=UPI0012249293|nr:BON domain-containing protein [Pandoraea sp.]TAL52307.1 MAG: BON domain-containing protein [Pandoraea sp.]TAM16117.1 MAG: BON domain-containing protein [Pandoraea sp.]